MKKQEFPTFINQQPTVVFGRNMRELMVILTGLALSYLIWANLGVVIRVEGVGILVCRIVSVAIVVAATIVVTFVKIASRPLEEWALVGIFYYCTPKIFIYMPFEDDEPLDEVAAGIAQHQKNKKQNVDDGFN